MEKKSLFKILRKNNKAQIPATLTWFVAFLIIFFIIILFLSSTFILSSKKKVKIDMIEHNSESLEAQRAMIFFLKVPVEIGGESKEIEDLIIWSVNKYGDRVEVFSTGGYNIKEGYNEIKEELNNLFENSDVIWDIGIYDKERYDNPTGGAVIDSNHGEYYMLKREDWICNPDSLVSFSKTLLNDKEPEEILVIFKFCKGHVMDEIEKAGAELTGGGP